MQSLTKTFLRAIAWVCVILGVLFTILQAWLAGPPLLAVGLLFLVFTSRPTTESDETTEASSESTEYGHSYTSDNVHYGSGADARDPLFGVGDKHLR